MTFEEELRLFKECLKQANSMFDIAIKYFNELPEKIEDYNRFKYDKYLDLLKAATHIIFEVDLDLGCMLSRLKDDEEETRIETDDENKKIGFLEQLQHDYENHKFRLFF